MDKILQDEHNTTTTKDYEKIFKQVEDWITEIYAIPKGKFQNYVKVIQKNETKKRYKLYANNICYTLVCDAAGDYLGGYMSNRYYYPGEEHLRGADFPDGKICKAVVKANFYRAIRQDTRCFFEPLREQHDPQPEDGVDVEITPDFGGVDCPDVTEGGMCIKCTCNASHLNSDTKQD